MQFQLRRFNLWQIVLTSPLLALVTILAGCQADPSPIVGTIYTANEEGNSISVVDASSNNLLATVPAGEEPHNIQVAPDGKTVWVTNLGAGDVWVLDAATLNLIAKVPVGRNPAHVVLTPDGSLALVGASGDDSVIVIDTTKKERVQSIKVGM